MPPARQQQPSANDVAQAVSQNLMEAMRNREAELDAEIGRLDDMGVDELEELRQIRRQKMLSANKRHAAFKDLGHGVYSEVHDEMEFFNACKNSAKVICHFYKPDQNIERKEIVDKHLTSLAPDLIDIRFITGNVERLPFLTSRLNIFIVPSIVFVKEQKMTYTMLGFEDLGRKDDFSTADLVNVFKAKGMMTKFNPDWKDNREEIIEDPDADDD